MKKAVSILLIIAILLVGCACGKAPKTQDRLAQIKDKGYIELCTEPYFAPYEFIDPTKTGDEQYVGMDIEIAKCIAEKIGVELKIVPLDFSAVLAGVADGKYDMAISAIAYSPVRADAMSLSDVYLQESSGYGFLVRAEDAGKYESIDDLKDAIVITQSGSVQEALYNQNVKACKEFKLMANMTDAYLAVAENKADVCICSTASAGLYAEANGSLIIPDFRFDVDPNMNGTVVAMPLKDTDSLKAVINEVIKELNDQGKITAWEEEFSEYASSLGLD